MISRRDLLAALGGLVALSACQPSGPGTAPTPTANATPTDYTAPGATRPALDALCAAAGSTTLVKAEVSATDASVAVLTGPKADKAETWAWRDGRPQLVDGDTQNVGQARFSLDDFNLSDVRGLLTLAGVVAGSARSQALQVVEYSGGKVLMTVTTQPESRAVFFRPDGTLIRPLDYAWPADLRDGLADAVAGLQRVTAIGLTPGVGLWAELAGSTAVLRQIRAERTPTRSETRSDASPLARWDFAPADIDVDVLVELARRLGAGRAVTFTIDRRDHRDEPFIRLTADGRTTIWSLDGDDWTSILDR